MRASAAAAVLVLCALGGAPAAQAPGSAAPYTVLSREGRRPLATRVMAGQEMFALDDLARLFNLTMREDAAAGGLTVTAGSQTIVLSAGQSLASVSGRLISLPAPPAHEGRTWYVPVDFVTRALAPALPTTRIELRKPSRLLLIGDVRAPRVVGRIDPLGSAVRVTLDIAPATVHTISQEAQRLIVKFDADTLDLALPAATSPDLVQNIHQGDTPSSIAIDLGPKFASFRTSDVPGDRGAGRLVIDIAGQATEVTQPTPPGPPAQPPTEIPPLIDLVPSGTLRAIVIDAGHGGSEQGAKGPGEIGRAHV